MLIEAISTEFKIDSSGLNLREISGLAESKRNRNELINCVRSKFKKLKPFGSILNLPLYSWKSIYTTNYDKLVEDAYERDEKPLKAYSSNFDFSGTSVPGTTKLFKYTEQLKKI